MKKSILLVLFLMCASVLHAMPLDQAKYGPGVTVLDNLKIRYQFAPSITMVSPNTSTTVYVGPQSSTYIIRNGATVGTLNIVLPAAATITANASIIDGFNVRIGTVSAISVLSITAADSKTVKTTPASLAALKMLYIVYSKALSTWYCFAD